MNKVDEEIDTMIQALDKVERQETKKSKSEMCPPENHRVMKASVEVNAESICSQQQPSSTKEQLTPTPSILPSFINYKARPIQQSPMLLQQVMEPVPIRPP